MAGPPLLAGKVILVVEDESLIALELGIMLEGAGATRIVTAPSLDRAKTAVAQMRPDLVILDLLVGAQKTLIFGGELVAACVPLVIVSVIDDPRSLPPELQKVPFVAKPFREEDLLAAIATAL